MGRGERATDRVPGMGGGGAVMQVAGGRVAVLLSMCTPRTLLGTFVPVSVTRREEHKGRQSPRR